jgi:hypothetical protein
MLFLPGSHKPPEDLTEKFAREYNPWLKMWNDMAPDKLHAKEMEMWEGVKGRWNALREYTDNFYRQVKRQRL